MSVRNLRLEDIEGRANTALAMSPDCCKRRLAPGGEGATPPSGPRLGRRRERKVGGGRRRKVLVLQNEPAFWTWIYRKRESASLPSVRGARRVAANT